MNCSRFPRSELSSESESSFPRFIVSITFGMRVELPQGGHSEYRFVRKAILSSPCRQLRPPYACQRVMPGSQDAGAGRSADRPLKNGCALAGRRCRRASRHVTIRRRRSVGDSQTAKDTSRCGQDRHDNWHGKNLRPSAIFEAATTRQQLAASLPPMPTPEIVAIFGTFAPGMLAGQTAVITGGSRGSGVPRHWPWRRPEPMWRLATIATSMPPESFATRRPQVESVLKRSPSMWPSPTRCIAPSPMSRTHSAPLIFS